MRITIRNELEKVTITSHPFSLTGEINLSGLGANIEIVDTNRDGGQFIKSLFGTRDVDFQGHIRTYGMKKETIQKHRNQLYRAWNPKLKTTVTFEDEDEFYQIEGYPTAFPIFQTGFENSNNHFQRFLLQMTCHDPFIYKRKRHISFSTVESNFAFPIDFTSVNFGEVNDTLIKTIVNDGVMDCPLEIKMRAKGNVVNPFLLNLSSGEKIQLNTTLETGEEVYINTGRTKEVSKIVNGVKTNFYSALSLESDFMQLNNIGDNVFRFGADSGQDFILVEIAYRERIGGI